ncbi:MAG: hypothetical protein H6701_15810 [Myxococcales bacterium]|nr:hypothetical protein [Myxococcales bacterium]
MRAACGVARTLACAAAPDPAAGGITVEFEADEVAHLLVEPRVDADDLHYALVAEPADG